MYSRINHKNEYKDKVKRSSMKNVLNIYIQDLISRIYVFWQRCPQTFDTHVFSGSSKTSEKNPGLQGKFWTFQTYLEQGKLNSEEKPLKFQSTVVHFPFPPDSTPLAFDFESPCPALPAAGCRLFEMFQPRPVASAVPLHHHGLRYLLTGFTIFTLILPLWSNRTLSK